MPATIIDCKGIALDFESQVRGLYTDLRERGVTPTFATILPNDDPWSTQYVRMLGRICAAYGVQHREYAPKTDTQIVETINTVNADDSIHGVLLLSPLRTQSKLDKHEIANSIAQHKDVEGLSIPHKGRLEQRYESGAIVPPTAMAVVSVLHRYQYDFLEAGRSKVGVIINRSEVIGKPLRHMLEHDSMTVLAVDEYVDPAFLSAVLPYADLVVTAVPSPAFKLDASRVKQGAAVIAVTGSNIEGVADGFDVYDALLKKCSLLNARAAAKNNIGQITSTLTMRNLYYLAARRRE